MQPTGEWLNQPGGLAERLELMRKDAGFTSVRMAEQLGWPRTKISKLENGRQMPTVEDVTAWAQACGQAAGLPALLAQLEDARSVYRRYRQQVRRGHAALQDDFDKLVRGAATIRNAEVTVVPGLLQTADYMRYRMQEAVRVHGFATDGVETAVAARMRRQEVLYDPERQFEFVLTEAVLRLLLCPPQVMLGQVDRLAGLAGLANIRLGIIPFGRILPVAPMLAFLLADDTACIETPSGDIFRHGDDALPYSEHADALMAEAATGDEARLILASASGWLRGMVSGA